MKRYASTKWVSFRETPEEFERMTRDTKGFPDHTAWGSKALHIDGITHASGIAEHRSYGRTGYNLVAIHVSSEQFGWRVGILDGDRISSLID